jgi:NADPH-dependent 2,4-dienoyl-CoA reductase/sulfur reductase-like enzyme
VTEKHLVVIGNGPAGSEAARTLREKAPGHRVTIVSRDHLCGYSPRLLPDFIAGKIGEEDLFPAPFEEYAGLGIKVRSCQEAASLDLEERRVVLGHKEVIPFHGLIVAVGGIPFVPESLKACGENFLTLKTLEDARVWIERLEEVSSVLLMGGDLTCLAVAKALRHLGKEVTLILTEEAFWPLRPDEELFHRVVNSLSGKGVEVLARGKVESLERLPDGSCEVRVKGGPVRADMAGAFFGLVPDVGFLKKSGLKIDRGILVDEHLNAGVPGVYAAGDCAQVYHPELGDYWVSVGHDNARHLGRTAALNLTGGEAREKTEPDSVFEVRGIKVNTSWWTDF